MLENKISLYKPDNDPFDNINLIIYQNVFYKEGTENKNTDRLNGFDRLRQEQRELYETIDFDRLIEIAKYYKRLRHKIPRHSFNTGIGLGTHPI